MLFGADLIFWHHAIEAVGAGLATVLGNLQVVMVGILAWVILREKPEARLVAAIPVALFGVVLISGVLGEGGYGDDPTMGVVFGVLTALSYSGFILLLRGGGQDLRQPAGPLFDATFVALITSLVAGAFTGDLSLEPGWPGHGWLVTLALTSQVLGWLLISISLPRLPAALTSVLLTIQPVGSVFLGMLILEESPNGMQLIGVICILAGVVLAAARKSNDRLEQVTEAAGP